jgi:hypothetical protein
MKLAQDHQAKWELYAMVLLVIQIVSAYLEFVLIAFAIPARLSKD